MGMPRPRPTANPVAVEQLFWSSLRPALMGGLQPFSALSIQLVWYIGMSRRSHSPAMGNTGSAAPSAATVTRVGIKDLICYEDALSNCP